MDLVSISFLGHSLFKCSGKLIFFQDSFPSKAGGEIYKRTASKSLNTARYLLDSLLVFTATTGQRHQFLLYCCTTAKTWRGSEFLDWSLEKWLGSGSKQLGQQRGSCLLAKWPIGKLHLHMPEHICDFGCRCESSRCLLNSSASLTEMGPWFRPMACFTESRFHFELLYVLSSTRVNVTLSDSK